MPNQIFSSRGKVDKVNRSKQERSNEEMDKEDEQAATLGIIQINTLAEGCPTSAVSADTNGIGRHTGVRYRLSIRITLPKS